MTLRVLEAMCSNLIYLLDQAPQYHKGHKIVLAFVILAWVLIAANVYVETPRPLSDAKICTELTAFGKTKQGAKDAVKAISTNISNLSRKGRPGLPLEIATQNLCLHCEYTVKVCVNEVCLYKNTYIALVRLQESSNQNKKVSQDEVERWPKDIVHKYEVNYDPRKLEVK